MRYASYTMTLDEVIESWDIGLKSPDDTTVPREWTYPIWDERYRATLNFKIIDHYRYREIGVETPQMFIFLLNRTMREQMSLYNTVYKAQALMLDPRFDPLSSFGTKTTSINNSISKSESKVSALTSAENSSKSGTLDSTYPQSQLMSDQHYATSGTQSEGVATNKGTSESDSTTTDNVQGGGDTHSTGYTVPQASLIQAYMDAIINVDMLVIQSLEPCFMQLLASGDIIPTDSPLDRYGLNTSPLYGGMTGIFL